MTAMKPKATTSRKELKLTKVHRLGELFCGPGGIACGARGLAVEAPDGRVHKIHHAWANDYDVASCETILRNNAIDPDHLYCEPVDKFIERFDSLGPIDGLAFGFPCNDFSNIGEKKGLKGKFGPLFEYGAHALEHFKPTWFLAENVGGLTNSNEGKTFKLILDRLRNAGPKYQLTAHLYRFEDYGVPQKRHRIVIVGVKRGENLPSFSVPAPTHVGSPMSAKEALERDPPVSTLKNNEPTKQATQVIQRLEHTRPGENAWNADLPAHLQLNVKGARLSNIYRRLDEVNPSYTVTGSGGGGTHMYHYSEARALTNRERARLQTFPDDYHFLGTKEEVRKQIGMAVPPRGARIILQSILRTLAGVEYPSVPAHWEDSIGEEKD